MVTEVFNCVLPVGYSLNRGEPDSIIASLVIVMVVLLIFLAVQAYNYGIVKGQLYKKR